MEKGPIFSDTGSLELFQKPKELTKKGFKLIKLDSSQAYFLDSEGKPWLFDIEKRLWREMEKDDVALAKTDTMSNLMRRLGVIDIVSSEELQKIPEFKDVDEAMIYSLKKHFQNLMAGNRKYAEQFEENIKYEKNEDLKERDKKTLKEMYRRRPIWENILNILDQLGTAENVEEKEKLARQFDKSALSLEGTPSI